MPCLIRHNPIYLSGQKTTGLHTLFRSRCLFRLYTILIDKKKMKRTGTKRKEICDLTRNQTVDTIVLKNICIAGIPFAWAEQKKPLMA